MAQPATGRSHRIRHLPEVDLLPVMNLFCVIIPFLLLSASFLEITIIEMTPTEGIAASGRGTTSLAQSEEQQLQPKVIMTREQMFLGTVFGTNPVSGISQEIRHGEVVDTYDFAALSEALEEFRGELDSHYATIPVHRIIILTDEDVRYDNIVMAMDVCADHGFDQPGLQVAAYGLIQRQIEAAGGSGGDQQ